MHIPDGFLSTPVWAAMDALAVPTVGLMARRAAGTGTEARAPLLGVLGAFVFAAQLVNFPVGPGISSHLVGAALLTYTVGPAAATVVMTAVLIIQAFVFQDGGILALGANICNLAVASIFAAYLPYRLLRGKRLRSVAVFTGSVFSVLVSGSLALLQIVLSGVPMPLGIVSAGFVFFLISAAIEGTITLAVLGLIERMNPAWVWSPSSNWSPVVKALALASLVMACFGLAVASTQPDVLDSLTGQAGLGARSYSLLFTPFADYNWSALGEGALSKALVGLIGASLALLLCVGAGKLLSRRAE